MNILFVLYGDFSSNSANPLVLYARELHSFGHSCAVAVPSNLETVCQHENPTFRPILYDDVLAAPESVFLDGRPADVIHAWTPREVVRRFITSYMAKKPTPLVIYLEDNESWIATRALGLDEATLVRHTEREISARLPEALAHPFYLDSFIGLADAVAIIQDKLKIEVPLWVHCETVLLGVDIEFFSPRSADSLLRKQYGVAETERVIVYHGGLNGFTKPAIETLCRAVGLINQQGYPCRLLRTGPFALDFLVDLPRETASAISDLGLLPRHELPNLLALADVFVQPGQIDAFEDLRLPGKLPEFFAMGRPVIMPNVNIAHLFKDGFDALLLQSGSADEIAAKCIELFNEPQRAGEIGRAGRHMAEKYFDVKSQARRLEDVYNAARNNFDPAIAAETWRDADEDTPVNLLLARKLNLLADSRDAIIGIKAGAMLRAHARYIETMQQRLMGLESSIARRDRQIGPELKAKNDLAIELDEIKNSLAWALVVKSRALRNRVLVEGTVRRKIYEIAKDLIKVLMLFRGPTSRLNAGEIRRLAVKAFQMLRAEGISGFGRRLKNKIELGYNDYPEWMVRFATLTDADRAAIVRHIERLPHQPLISLIMPVYNTPENWLRLAIESVTRQVYPHWELCIADDASSNPLVKRILEEYRAKDARVKVTFRKKNGHISAASNSAIEMATGEFIALLDHDDELTEHALYMVAVEINAHPEADLIYSDEDKIDDKGRRYGPYFKPEWNPALFLAQNFICHLAVYRASFISQIGGFRPGYDGAQDWDLAMRVIERIPSSNIRHIPYVLYHWRAIPGSTAIEREQKGYALEAQRKTLRSHFDHLQRKVDIVPVAEWFWRIKYPLPEPPPRVTLIIPTRNGFDLLHRCVESIHQKTTYRDYELIIVDNQSDDPATLNYLAQLEREHGIRILRYDGPFNFSAINNFAVRHARGEIIGLLNNDLEVISPDWLEEMSSYAIQSELGAIGAMLYYPNNRIQHAGVILGMGDGAPGAAGHPYKGRQRGYPGQASRALLCQNLSAVTAACLVVRRQLYEEVGGLDEVNLGVAFNDIDLCLRIREKGYLNLWTPFAELYHHESASRGYEVSPQKQQRLQIEIEYMKQRWGDSLLNDPAYNANLALDREAFSLAFPPRVQKPWLEV